MLNMQLFLFNTYFYIILVIYLLTKMQITEFIVEDAKKYNKIIDIITILYFINSTIIIFLTFKIY